MTAREVTTDEALEILHRGRLEVLGRMPWSSNQTFLSKVDCDGLDALAIYKPRRGERPLWDFPGGSLCDREVASFAVSEALGWAIVPPTVLRDGPLGDGMVQLFIDHDPEDHYLTLREEHAERFRAFAAFDVVINNADRKAGHCVHARDGHIWGIDHGLSFHPSPKLRTVIWDFTGETLPRTVSDDLRSLERSFDGDIAGRLIDLLSPTEVEVTRRRLRRLLAENVFPAPRTEYPFPWPMV